MTPRRPFLRLVAFALAAGAAPAAALDLQGTVAIEGQLLFADYDATGGLGHDDLRVRVDAVAEATGPGVRCSVEASTTAIPDEATGLYAVSADVRMERGGPQVPEGECILVLRAAGWDGVATSAHAVGAVAATAADLQGGGTVVPAVMFARISRAAAGLSSDCKRYAKKRLKLRNSCNALILKLGGVAAAEKCKDVDFEPVPCDEGDHVEAALGVAHGGNDQQTDVALGQAVDLEMLGAQGRCQALMGKAAVKFMTALAARIQSECVKPGDDSEACRAQQAAAVRKKLDAIDDCQADPAADGATGRVVPAVGGSCSECLAGGTDAKCLKDCFERELRALADGLVGDAPVCGDGVLQNGEFCDDGNGADGDGCSALCGLEAAP